MLKRTLNFEKIISLQFRNLEILWSLLNMVKSFIYVYSAYIRRKAPVVASPK